MQLIITKEIAGVRSHKMGFQVGGFQVAGFRLEGYKFKTCNQPETSQLFNKGFFVVSDTALQTVATGGRSPAPDRFAA
jgi:hypothetical protein